ncbi:MAG: 50S ribosomal protein L25 [Candidatus Azambacteria bacterium]|nr:50S ribosomal protein L25 [Candidatus Azambacteria bacterium]
MTKIKAQPRSDADKVGPIRKAGGIPAVVYGHKIKNINLTVDGRAFEKVYRAAGKTTILDLNIEGEGDERSVLIHDVAVDPVQSHIIHVDFYEVKKGEKITTHIPLVFTGESPAVKVDGGVLVKNIYKVEIEALPKDLPHEITVDISKLVTFNDVMTIGDLDIPEGVKVFGDQKEVIAKVIPPRTTEELESLEKVSEVKVDDIKVETEEKKKERDAEKLVGKEGEK